MGYLIFFSRWLQAPLYIGLIVAQLAYVVVFAVELGHIIEKVVSHPLDINEAEIMLLVLGLIDVVMISNLLIMVIIGGYETFVSRINIDGHPDQPEWLSHVNANVLKVKLAMAIIGISSIHLLKTFIEIGDIGASHAETVTEDAENYTGEGVFWQVTIHMVFIFSAIALAMIDKMGSKAVHPAAGANPSDHTLPSSSDAPAAAAAEPAGQNIPEGAEIVNGYFVDGKFVRL